MNVADIELCKELFKLSKWESELTWAATKQDNTVLVSSHEKELGHDLYRVAYAYDLGYLLRKLPLGVEVAKTVMGYRADAPPAQRKRCIANTYDSPEDATCRLAIELHKSGILPTPQDYKET